MGNDTKVINIDHLLIEFTIILTASERLRRFSALARVRTE